MNKTVQIKQADGLLVSLEDAYKSLPKLPKGFTDFLVTVTPWLTLIGGVLLFVVVGILGFIGLIASIAATVLALAPQYVIMMIITLAIAVVQGALMLLAFKPLQQKSLAGWRMLAYVELLSVVSTILTLSVAGIIWGLIWNAVGFYILFQIKSYYK
jgi:hypothetical protein